MERPLGRKGKCLKLGFPGGTSKRGSQVRGWSQAEQRTGGKKKKSRPKQNPPEKSGKASIFRAGGNSCIFKAMKDHSAPIPCRIQAAQIHPATPEFPAQLLMEDKVFSMQSEILLTQDKPGVALAHVPASFYPIFPWRTRRNP